MPEIWETIFRKTAMTKSTLPAVRGAGSGDLSADARHFTVFALREIDRLMRASDDEKLRFACAKYLLEQGWGRPAPRKPDAAPDETLSPELRAQLYALLDRMKAAQPKQLK